jgi:NAD(P)-dependent dehydrogenase (short-subunit alcohol dehydrogenase family)
VAAAVVTGASGGIGTAVVDRLLARGDSVLAADLEPPRHAPGPAFVPVEADLRDEPAVERLFDLCEEAFGRLDFVVHVAGAIGRAPIATTDHVAWRGMVHANLDATFLVVREAARRLADQGRGAIVTVGSVAARSGGTGIGAYAATKAAVEALTRVAALELAPSGVRANAVVPGIVDTPMIAGSADLARAASGIPIGRLGRPGDVAAAIDFLLSDDATYVTGQTLVVDGGLAAS